MATIKNYTLDLSSLASQGSAKLEANKNVAIKLGSETVASVNTGSAGANQVSLANFGTVRTTDGKLVDFVADAGIAAGQYGVSLASSGTPVSLNSFDASKATNDLKVSVTAAQFDATGAKKVATGSGKDTIYLDAGLVAFGGANADTFEVNASKGGATISDYNYAEGDVVKYSDTFTNSALGWVNDEATITGSGTNTTIQAANNNGVFQVLLEDNTNTKTLAAKAAVDAAVEVTLDKIAGVVDVADAKSAVVDLGTGNDAVEGVGTTELTLKVGMNDGTNSVDAALGADDTIRFSSGSWNAVTVDAASNGVKFGNTTLASVLSSTTNTFNVQFGDGEAQKVAYTTDTSANVAEYKKDINFYLGKNTANSGISVNAADEEVNLNLITGAKNIVNVTVSAAKALNLVAAGDSSIDASAASHSGDYVFDLTASGTGDTLNLFANNNSKDIVKLSTAGGKDTITGFSLDDDVLVLDDVSAITDKTFVYDNSNNLYLGSSVTGAQVAGVLATARKDVTVQLADGTTEKVAMIASGGKITATEDTSLVLNLDSNTTKLSLTSKAAGQMFDMTNVVNDGVKFVGNSFEEVTIDTANGVAMFIGTKGVDSISVSAGTSENGAAVWAGKDNDATVSLSAGADIVWAGFLDGDVTVSGITKDDAVYTYGENLDAKAVAGKLSYNDTNNLVFASSDSTKMDLGAAAVTGTAFKVAGNAGSLYNVVGMDRTNKVSYSEDADILVGDDATLNVMVEKTVGIDLSGTMGLDSKVYSGIKSIDASQSTSNSCLVLANSAGGRITASAGGSAMWGGGNESQTLIGGYGADLFWFGSTDGADVAQKVSKDDCVFLYNAADISEVEIGGTNNNQLIFTATGSTLTFAPGCVDVTQMTFSINDLENPGSFKNYSYDATSKTFVEKK